MNIPKIWEQSFRVHSFQMDPKGKAQLITICNYLQEAASLHAHHAGFGFEDMVNKNQVWVLTRLKVRIDNYPVWNDEVKLVTWSRGNEGIFYLRDYKLLDQEEKPIVMATSSWAALNIKSRRPEMVDHLEDALYSLKEEIALEPRLEKLPELQNEELIKKYRVQFTDIDLVYHVNNVKYIEMAMNAFPIEMHNTKSVTMLEVNYLGEANFGDEVEIWRQELNNTEYLISIRRGNNGREVCKLKFTWK